ncbi:MAG: DUF5674 family protein, partial [Methylococcales bacterium]
PNTVQFDEMLKALGGYIKVAVDIRREILAGGGVMHADCEAVLLESGSKQEDIWGADWYPNEKKVDFKSLINIRPRQNNRDMDIQDQDLKQKVERIVRKHLE